MIFSQSNYTLHCTGNGHPEKAERISSIEKALEKAGLLQGRRVISQSASKEDLLLVHDAAYIAKVERECTSGLPELSTGDVAISEESYAVALTAAAAAIEAVKFVFSENPKRAFCLIRPPGHHASREKGEGFCIFNNAAIAARTAQKYFGVKRVAILDWDVHHGNGTEAIFANDPSVLYFSTHESPLYPGTGLESANNIHNFPIKAGKKSREEVLRVYKEELPEVLKEFKPQLIILSCGFDGREKDTLGGFNLTDRDFADLTRIALEQAKLYAEGRVVSLLEGGYALKGISSAAVEHVRVLQSG